jgi:hypothetical protein
MRHIGILAAVAAVAVVVPLQAAGSSTSGPAAQSGCTFFTKAVRNENRAATQLTQRLSQNAGFVTTTRTVTPRIQRTRGFTGFGTIVVPAPQGSAAIVGSFELVNAQQCSIEITDADVVLRRNAFVLKFKAPGEQGNPGKIRVTLISV